MSNAEGQSPCLVAADLQGVCNDDKWFIPSLPSGTHYVGPLTPALGTLCICNTVVYNLVSACAACQGGEWVAWADWTANCSVQVMTRGSFPGPVPGGTSVPAWAEVDTSLEGSWNAVEARTVAASGLPDTFPSSTSPGITTSTSFSSSPTTTSPASSSHTNVGAIAGGVVGGVLLLLLLLLALFLLRMRKNRRNAARTAPIPLPTSYSSLSSRGANSSPPTGGERDGSVIVVGPGSGYSGYPSSPGAEKAGFLSTHSAHGHGTGTGNGGTHSPPYSPNSPLSPAFPPSSVNTAASQGTGTGGTFSGSGTNPASSGFVLYDPNDPATWPTNVPVGLPGMPHSPGGTRTQNQRGSTQSGYLSHLSASGSLPSPGGAFPSHYPGYSMGEAQPGPGSGAGAASVAGGASAVLDSDRAYSPVPTPAPTYRSSASPAPGRDGVGDRVLLRGPARVVGKRRGGGQGQGR
ncbi:hypothetical protein CALCODRAFT_328423 [Calocera cornea HHB12733]|uniref:Uncharacterized protein n=1 Tax=Calocera cornea HHB12733 TaxID=1353952 RepID=A0A165JHT6_9BASI|nr:hypothetical protein CALCODRAFT_328423 [Calocera cornea HHB12733]